MELNNLDDLYKIAVNDIKGKKGVITITIDGIPKISKSNDIIGNCVQEWIPQWLEDKGLNLVSNKNTQQFPDFTAEIAGKHYDMEVKCWNINRKPGFDLANFDGFYREVYKNPKKLEAKYLVFGYNPTQHGFEIVEIYLKNIWELTAPTKSYPIGLQNKQGKLYALRPSNFHKNPDITFKSKNDFLDAIKAARERFPIENMVSTEDWIKKLKGI